jgi:hypothetical protein
MNRLQLNMRLSADESARLDEGATQFRTTRSGFVRRAVAATLEQRPLLTPTEIEALYLVADQVRRVGSNVNVILRHLHLYQNEVQDRPPPIEELEAAAAAIRGVMEDVSGILARFP